MEAALDTDSCQKAQWVDAFYQCPDPEECFNCRCSCVSQSSGLCVGLRRNLILLTESATVAFFTGYVTIQPAPIALHSLGSPK